MIRLSVILILFPALLFGQSGELIPSFGNQGKLILDIDDLDNLVGLCSDDDENTIFFGNTSENLIGEYPYDIFIGKLNSSGELDQSFADQGIFRADFPSHSISSIEKAVYHSSGIYFIGKGRNPASSDSSKLFVGKLNLDGSLDLNFADNGYFTDSFLGAYNTPGSLIIDQENRIVFCGSTTDDQGTLVEYPLIGRLNLDGSPDLSFGTTGVIVWDYHQGVLIDYMHVNLTQDRHGEGLYLNEILEINNTYFLCGKYLLGAFSQVHYMSITKEGEMNPNFISPGPINFQIDPGYNNYITSSAFDGENIYLGMLTDGELYNGKQLLQKIDTNGVLSTLRVIEKEGQDLQTKFVKSWDNRIFIGGYDLSDENIGPGVHSDKFSFKGLDTNLEPLSGFNFHESITSNEDQGAEDLVLYDNHAILGGYANDLVGNNITDLVFMSFKMDEDVSIEEDKLMLQAYPNPCTEHLELSIPMNESNIRIINILGQEMSFTWEESRINCQSFPKGAYVLLLSGAIDEQLKFIVE